MLSPGEPCVPAGRFVKRTRISERVAVSCQQSNTRPNGLDLVRQRVEVRRQRYDSLLRQGAVLIDDSDPGDTPSVLVYLQHAVVGGRRITPAIVGGVEAV